MASRPDFRVLEELSAARVGALATREARLAFWINTYNALVARGIAALGLRESVWEVPQPFDRIGCQLEGLPFSADDIEHGILRGNRPNPLTGTVPFRPGDPRDVHVVRPPDPRVHFALSCGARSCPPVRHYDAGDLDAQLDAATRAYVNREIALEEGRLALSPIFRWFREDFAATPDGLKGFLLRYLDEGPAREALRRDPLAVVTWRPWDWRLARDAAAGEGAS